LLGVLYILIDFQSFLVARQLLDMLYRPFLVNAKWLRMLPQPSRVALELLRELLLLFHVAAE
jgi:hypothetical protein